MADIVFGKVVNVIDHNVEVPKPHSSMSDRDFVCIFQNGPGIPTPPQQGLFTNESGHFQEQTGAGKLRCDFFGLDKCRDYEQIGNLSSFVLVVFFVSKCPIKL